MGDWYYIGHYGQLGPLTREQIDELIDGDVIARDTYVWKAGMSDWVPAAVLPELAPNFRNKAPEMDPPPPPGLPRPVATPTSTGPAPVFASYARNDLAKPVSDRSRVTAGVLQIIPGVGRMYLGYSALGALQLFLGLCTGIGFVWSWIDGILILTRNVPYDGYGRRLRD